MPRAVALGVIEWSKPVPLYDDEAIPGMIFDSEGICNYCRTHEQMNIEYPTGVEGNKKLFELDEDRKSKFDCAIGVSGGCDSSYLLWLAKEKLGLRPLAAQFDNTWNSKIAVDNLHKVLKALDIVGHNPLSKRS
jgi:hypothetical protein